MREEKERSSASSPKKGFQVPRRGQTRTSLNSEEPEHRVDIKLEFGSACWFLWRKTEDHMKI